MKLQIQGNAFIRFCRGSWAPNSYKCILLDLQWIWEWLFFFLRLAGITHSLTKWLKFLSDRAMLSGVVHRLQPRARFTTPERVKSLQHHVLLASKGLPLCIRWMPRPSKSSKRFLASLTTNLRLTAFRSSCRIRTLSMTCFLSLVASASWSQCMRSRLLEVLDPLGQANFLDCSDKSLLASVFPAACNIFFLFLADV